MRPLPIKSETKSPASKMRGFFAFEVTQELPSNSFITQREVKAALMSFEQQRWYFAPT